MSRRWYLFADRISFNQWALYLGTPNWLSIRIRIHTPSETFWDHDLSTLNKRTLPLAEKQQSDLILAFTCPKMALFQLVTERKCTRFFFQNGATLIKKEGTISSARPLGLLWCLNIVLWSYYANFASDILRDQNSWQKKSAEKFRKRLYFASLSFLRPFSVKYYNMIPIQHLSSGLSTENRRPGTQF